MISRLADKALSPSPIGAQCFREREAQDCVSAFVSGHWRPLHEERVVLVRGILPGTFVRGASFELGEESHLGHFLCVVSKNFRGDSPSGPISRARFGWISIHLPVMAFSHEGRVFASSRHRRRGLSICKGVSEHTQLPESMAPVLISLATKPAKNRSARCVKEIFSANSERTQLREGLWGFIKGGF